MQVGSSRVLNAGGCVGLEVFTHGSDCRTGTYEPWQYVVFADPFLISG